MILAVIDRGAGWEAQMYIVNCLLMRAICVHVSAAVRVL